MSCCPLVGPEGGKERELDREEKEGAEGGRREKGLKADGVEKGGAG